MYLSYCVTILIFNCILLTAQRKNEGDECRLPDGSTGVCRPFKNCPNANAPTNRPEICGFQGKYPIICCKAQPGVKSKKFCSKIYTLRAELEMIGLYGIYGGWKSLAAEFPHMAALGYGSQDDIQWGCGGTLISYKHVLTAAHCINSRELGDVQFVRLGDLDLFSNKDLAQPQNFTIVNRIKHPEYRLRSKYHDLAILELNKAVNLSDYVKPACLQADEKIFTNNLTASGWGRLEFGGHTASHLQKVYLLEVPNDKCNQHYKSEAGSKLKNGIVKDWQLCAGLENADTCQGDSGGPLQIRNFNYTDGQLIVGITSFGKACGISNSPGVYTRVSNYIEWIESVVWP